MLERLAALGRDVSNLGQSISHTVRSFVNKVDSAINSSNKAPYDTIKTEASSINIFDLIISQESSSNISSISSVLAGSGTDDNKSDNTSNDNTPNDSQSISQNTSDDSDNDASNLMGLDNNNNNQNIVNNNHDNSEIVMAHPIHKSTSLPNDTHFAYSDIFQDNIFKVADKNTLNSTLFLPTDRQLLVNIDYIHRILNKLNELATGNKSLIKCSDLIIDIYLNNIEIPYRAGRINLEKVVLTAKTPKQDGRTQEEILIRQDELKTKARYIFPLGFANLARELMKCEDNEKKIAKILTPELIVEIATQLPIFFQNFLFNQLNEEMVVHDKIYNCSGYYSMLKTKVEVLLKNKAKAPTKNQPTNTNTNNTSPNQLTNFEANLNSLLDKIAADNQLSNAQMKLVFDLYEKHMEIYKYRARHGKGTLLNDNDSIIKWKQEYQEMLEKLNPTQPGNNISTNNNAQTNTAKVDITQVDGLNSQHQQYQEEYLLPIFNLLSDREKELNKVTMGKTLSPEDVYLNNLSIDELNALHQSSDQYIIPKIKANNSKNQNQQAIHNNNNNAVLSTVGQVIPSKSPFEESDIPNLSELRKFQNAYDLEHLEMNLKRFSRRLKVAQNNVQILYAIATFSDWQNQFCGEQLSSRFPTIIAKEFLALMKKLRNEVFVHSVDKFSVAKDASSPNSSSRLDFARQQARNAIHHALSYLKQLETGAVTNIEIFTIPQNEIDLVRSVTQKQPNSKYTGLKPDQQIHLFNSAILNGKIAVLAIDEFFSSNLPHYDVNAIFNIMVQDDESLNDEQLRLKMNLDSYLQALGQAIGLLQEHGAMPDLMKYRIYDKDFPILSKTNRDIREYRNVKAHEGATHHDLLEKVLSDVNSCNMGIFNELNQLFEKVKLEYNKKRDFDPKKASLPSFDEISKEYYSHQNQDASSSCYVM